MPVSQMDNQHLHNAIRMIYRGYDYLGRRVGVSAKAKLAALEIEVEIRRQGLRK